MAPSSPKAASRQRRDDFLERLAPRADGPNVATMHGGAIYAAHSSGIQAFGAEDHVIEILLSRVRRARVTRSGSADHEFDGAVGSLLIHPAHAAGRMAWPQSRESVIVALTQEALGELVASEFGTGSIALRPPAFGTVDPSALRIAQLLKAELTQREMPNALYVDSLILLLGVHILRHYSSMRKAPPVVRGGLSSGVSVRLQDYIEINLSRALPVPELAGIAGLSPRHFIQAFTKTFGMPPHRYVLERRLHCAEMLLTKGELTIAEVAYQSGFSSQSHLTTTMKKHRQKTPLQIRREG